MRIIKIELPDPPDTRECSGPDDWGDVLTIGKQLKRRKMSFNRRYGDYGVYMGNNIVGIKTMELNWRIGEHITYKSSEAMKKDWILD